MKKCNGLFGVLFGHNYRANYDVTPDDKPIRTERMFASDIIKIIEARSKKVYRNSVCTRCGDIK